MALEKANAGSLEEWETVVGDDFSLYYDSYSVDERVDSDSKVRAAASRAHFSQSCPPFFTLSFLAPTNALPRAL